MTPAEMAQLHRAEPTGQRAWSEAEFSAMLSANNALSVTCDAGFAVGHYGRSRTLSDHHNT